jgi:glycosyltransferase involved in cell wall biosynthesis
MSPAPRAPVTGIVTCFNEERHIRACLESLAWCDEIVVLDSFSSDRTPELARAVPRVRFLQRTYYGAAAAKNFAMEQATHEWMFILDADERCTPELQAEIEALLATPPGHAAFTLRRSSRLLGRPLRFSGWQNDRVVRLMRRGGARHENARVHPRVVTEGAAPLLAHPIVHFMVEDFRDYLERTVRYGHWGAAQAWREGRRSRVLLDVAFRPAWRFFRTYVLQLGVLDGRVGLVFCLCQAFATYSKWSILWSWQLDAARGVEPALPEFDEREETWRLLASEAVDR